MRRALPSRPATAPFTEVKSVEIAIGNIPAERTGASTNQKMTVRLLRYHGDDHRSSTLVIKGPPRLGSTCMINFSQFGDTTWLGSASPGCHRRPAHHRCHRLFFCHKPTLARSEWYSVRKGPCLPPVEGGPKRMCVKFAKSEFSGLGNFQTASSQRTKILNAQCPGIPDVREILPQHNSTKEVREVIQCLPQHYSVRRFG